MKNKSSNSKVLNKLYSLFFILIGVFLIFLTLHLLHIYSGNPIVFPSIREIFFAFSYSLGLIETYIAIGYTLLRTFLSLLISFLIAFILGILAALFHKIDLILKPFVSMCKCIPIPCFVFIIFVYFPLNKLLGSIIIVFMVIFPIMYEGVKSGINNIDQSIVESLKLEGFYRKNSIFKVLIPLSLPYILVSFLTSFGLALKVEITSEVLMNSLTLKGIGRMLYLAYTTNNFVDIYALVFIILIIFIILDSIIYILKSFLKKYIN